MIVFKVKMLKCLPNSKQEECKYKGNILTCLLQVINMGGM